MKGYKTKGIFLSGENEWISEEEVLTIIEEHLSNLYQTHEKKSDYSTLYISILIIIAFIVFLILIGIQPYIIVPISVVLTAVLSIYIYSLNKKKPKVKKKAEILEHSYQEKVFSLFEVTQDSRVLISHDNDYGISKELTGTTFDNEDVIVNEIKIANELLENYDKPILNNSDKSKIYEDSEIYSFDVESNLRECLNRINSDLLSSKEMKLSFPFVKDKSLIDFIEDHTVEVDDVNLKSKLNTSDFDQLKSLLNHRNRFKNELQDLIKTISDRFDLNVRNFTSYMNDMDAFRNKMILFSIEAAYYTFCPKCNSDFFKQSEFADYQFNESAQTRYDYKNDRWVCISCKDYTNQPIPVPKIYQELIQPVVRQLLMEHHTEREKLYNDIENQKIGYIEKYRKEIREINRINSSETEKIMTSIANLEAEFEADKENLEFFQNLIERQRSELDSNLSLIDNAFQKIKVDTQNATEISISEMSSEMNAIWANAEQTFNELSKIQRVADERRDQQFKTIIQNSEKQVSLAEKQISLTEEQTKVAQESNQKLDSISKNTQEAAKSVEHIATITQAEADKKGYDKSKKIGHNLKKFKNRVTTSVTGGSDLDRAKKDMNG